LGITLELRWLFWQRHLDQLRSEWANRNLSKFA